MLCFNFESIDNNQIHFRVKDTITFCDLKFCLVYCNTCIESECTALDSFPKSDLWNKAGQNCTQDLNCSHYYCRPTRNKIKLNGLLLLVTVGIPYKSMNNGCWLLMTFKWFAKVQVLKSLSYNMDFEITSSYQVMFYIYLDTGNSVIYPTKEIVWLDIACSSLTRVQVLLCKCKFNFHFTVSAYFS